MTADTIELTEEILHGAYAVSAASLSIRPEPVVMKSRDHASARARAIVWWVLHHFELVPYDDIAVLAGYSGSNIRHSSALVSISVSAREVRQTDQAIEAVKKNLKP